MLTMRQLHQRLHASTGVTFASLYPGAQGLLLEDMLMEPSGASPCPAPGLAPPPHRLVK